VEGVHGCVGEIEQVLGVSCFLRYSELTEYAEASSTSSSTPPAARMGYTPALFMRVAPRSVRRFRRRRLGASSRRSVSLTRLEALHTRPSPRRPPESRASSWASTRGRTARTPASGIMIRRSSRCSMLPSRSGWYVALCPESSRERTGREVMTLNSSTEIDLSR
jgi:hypothetical protein